MHEARPNDRKPRPSQQVRIHSRDTCMSEIGEREGFEAELEILLRGCVKAFPLFVLLCGCLPIEPKGWPGKRNRNRKVTHKSPHQGLKAWFENMPAAEDISSDSAEGDRQTDRRRHLIYNPP